VHVECRSSSVSEMGTGVGSFAARCGGWWRQVYMRCDAVHDCPSGTQPAGSAARVVVGSAAGVQPARSVACRQCEGAGRCRHGGNPTLP